MGQTIEKLFLGRISPRDDTYRTTQRQRQIYHEVNKYTGAIEKELPKESRELLGRIMELRDEETMIMERYYFEKGFAIGVKLTAEALLG